MTRPTGIGLNLTEIVKFFGHILPLKAMTIMNADVTDEALLHLHSEVVTMYGTKIEYSVIATAMDSDDRHTKTKSLRTPIMALSIPNDLKIKVAAVEDQPDSYELFQKTRDLYESFESAKVKDLRRPSGSSVQSVAQLHMYEEIWPELKHHDSIELKKPERVYAHLNRSTSKLLLC